jgi:TusA-related sulfurtransferase
MSIAQGKFEQCKVYVNLVADVRGVRLDEELKQVELSMARLKRGEFLLLYSTDFKNQDKLPEWINNHGYLFLGMMNDSSFYKVLVLKYS